MKQFILKNIVLAAILVLTLISSIFLIFVIWNKSQIISESMAAISEDASTLEGINAARRPNSVEQSEKMINADTDALNKKNAQVYRHFGKPYRPALLKFLKNISSTVELKSDLPVDPTLVAQPKAKPETESDEDENEETEDNIIPGAPTDEEKAVFDPASNLVIISLDEDALRAKLAELYSEVHQKTNDDTFVIPDTIQEENSRLFSRLFDFMIEAPEVVDPARAEDFRKAAAAKFAQAFALFREEIQELTLEDVTNRVAKEAFLDALGLPRLMRQRDCKNYIDYLYEKYLASDLIPGLETLGEYDREGFVQDLIYGKNLNRQALPVPEMVIPIIRNFQIKEDLFRRMKNCGIAKLNSLNAGVFYGSPMDPNDSESPVLVFTYTVDVTSTLESIDTFINSLHAAYKSDRVYVIRDIKLVAPQDDVVVANTAVGSHIDGESSRAAAAAGTQQVADAAGAATAGQQQTANDPAAALIAAAYDEYELTDPHNPEYGSVLIGEDRDNIHCTLVVNYLLYRADNITPQ